MFIRYYYKLIYQHFTSFFLNIFNKLLERFSKKKSFIGNDQYVKKLSRQNEWKASEQVRETERLAEIEKKKK